MKHPGLPHYTKARSKVRTAGPRKPCGRPLRTRLGQMPQLKPNGRDVYLRQLQDKMALARGSVEEQPLTSWRSGVESRRGAGKEINPPSSPHHRSQILPPNSKADTEGPEPVTFSEGTRLGQGHRDQRAGGPSHKTRKATPESDRRGFPRHLHRAASHLCQTMKAHVSQLPLCKMVITGVPMGAKTQGALPQGPHSPRQEDTDLLSS